MGRSRNSTEHLVAILAHELRNPLASVQGCAMTLLERDKELSSDLRDGLTRVIVGQSQRLDWLVRATGALAGVSRRSEGGRVDVSAALEAAGAATGTPVDAHGTIAFAGDGKRMQLALEALMFALGGSASDATAELSRDGASIRLYSAARDLGQGERQWKLDLARRLLREEGCQMTIRRGERGTTVRVRLPAVNEIVYEEEG